MSVWKPLSPSLPHRLAVGVACGMTDIGNVRVSNEDNFLIDEQLGFIGIADGMGGHEAGEVASADALLSMAHYLRAVTERDAGRARGVLHLVGAPDMPQDEHDHQADAGTLYDAVEFANQRMFQINMENQHAEGGGMGTTLTGFWQAEPNGPLLVFHVGDTRLYRLRGGRLTQLTRDQTMHQQALELGVRHNLPARNLLLQALGPSSGIQPELHACSTEAADLYLLCSDGLHGSTRDDTIGAILRDATRDTLEAACTRLIAQAKHDGSRDNITVVLLYCS